MEPNVLMKRVVTASHINGENVRHPIRGLRSHMLHRRAAHVNRGFIERKNPFTDPPDFDFDQN